MNWAWAQNDLKPAAKLVLMKLADRANDDGVCWPGKGSLCEACCVSKRTLDGIIQHLVERRLINVQRRRALEHEKLNDTNVYELLLKQGDLFQPGAESALVQKLHYGKNCRGVVQNLPEEGAKSAPESSLEPSVEPLKPSSTAVEVRTAEYQTAKGKTLRGEPLERFQDFWEVFDYKHGKAEAADAWLKAAEPAIRAGTASMAHIRAAAAATAAKRPELLERKGSPKMAEGWLSARRWEDHAPAAAQPQRPVPIQREWYQTRDGIQERACQRGILNVHFPRFADLIDALVGSMREKGESVPPELIGFRDSVRAGTANKRVSE